MPTPPHRSDGRSTHGPHGRSTRGSFMKLWTSRVRFLTPRIDNEAGTGSCLFSPQSTFGRNMDLETLGRLCAEAWHDDLPEADRAWAEVYREKFGSWVHDARPGAIPPKANAGSLED